MNNKNKANFLSYFINTAGASFISIVFKTASSIIIARTLGPEGKGELTLVLIVPMMVLTFGRMGVGHSINYHASKVSPNKIIFCSFFLAISLGIFSIIGSLLTLPFLSEMFFKDISIGKIYFVCLSIPFLFFCEFLPTVLQGMYLIKKRNLIFVMMSFLNLLLLILFVIIFNNGVWGGIYASFLSIVFASIIASVIVLKEKDNEQFRFDKILVMNVLRYGLKSHIGNIFKQLSYRGDILIISYFLEPIWIGYYAIAVNIAELLWKLPEALGIVLLPKIAHSKKDDAKEITPLVIRTLMYPMIILIFLLIVFDRYIINMVFGKEFLPAVMALRFMLPGIFALSFWKILANDLIGQGHAMKYSVTAGIATAMMISFDIILIPQYGINGAALATSISYITATGYIVYNYLKISDNSISALFIPIKSDFTLYKHYLSRTNFFQKLYLF